MTLVAPSMTHGYGFLGGTWTGGNAITGVLGKAYGTLEYAVDSSLDQVGGKTLDVWKGQIEWAISQWADVIGIVFEEATSGTSNAITFRAFEFDPNRPAPIARVTHLPVDDVPWSGIYTDGIIRFNSDPNIKWSPVGQAGQGIYDIGTVALHELGHLLGLGHTNSNKVYASDHNSIPTAVGFIDSSKTPEPLDMLNDHDTPKANSVPIMAQGIHFFDAAAVLHEDDIAGARWLYGSRVGSGSSLACIDTGGDLGETTSHHGPGIWTYQITVDNRDSGPAWGTPSITLQAGTNQGVSAASATSVSDPTASWTTTISLNQTTFVGDAGYKGNVVVNLTSHEREGIIEWSVGSIGATSSIGVTFGPVPEPTLMILLAVGSGLLLRRRGCQGRSTQGQT